MARFVPSGNLSAVSVLEKNFAKWLEKLVGSREYGDVVDVARRIGMDRSNVSRIIDGERPANLTLRKLERVAKGFDKKPWQILWMVDQGVTEWPPEMGSHQ